MGWRENGQRVFEHFKACIETSLQRKAEWPNPPPSHVILFQVLARAFQGDNTLLIKYLRSGNEFYLPAGACTALARFLDEEPWKARPGPRRDQDARWACVRANEIYEAWKEANANAGISDWGMRDEMKDESCRYGIAVAGPFAGGREPDFETVRQLMDRPKGRQKSYKRRLNKRGIRA